MQIARLICGTERASVGTPYNLVGNRPADKLVGPLALTSAVSGALKCCCREVDAN